MSGLLLLSALLLAPCRAQEADVIMVPEGGPPALAHPGQEGQGQLVVAGDGVGPAVVSRVEVHPEFERIHLVSPGATLPPVELVQRRLDREGLCVHHGLTLFPRWELVGPVPEDPWHEGERAPVGVEEQVHAALCARLAQVGEGIHLGRAATPAMQPRELPPEPFLALPVAAPPAGWLRPVVGLVAALTLGLAVVGARRLDRAGWRDLALVALVSGLARGLAAVPTVFNGALAGYEKLVFAFGWELGPTLYGQGWRALLAPVVDRLGAEPAVVLEAHRALATLAPVALWAAMRPLAGPAAARLGGLFLAVLPLAVVLAATEEMNVPVLALALIAAAAAAHAGPGLAGLAAGALAGLSAGLATHVRPESLLLLPAIAALPFALRGRAALRDGGPLLALLLGGLLVLLRLAELPLPRSDGPLAPGRLVDPLFLLTALLPAWKSERAPVHLFLDAAWTSPALWLGLALVLRAARGQVARLLPWGLWVLATGLLLAKSWPLADAWRLQLLAMPGWVALAACGLAPPLARRPAPQRAALVALLVALVALPLAWCRLDLARHHEWRWLARAVPALPAGSVVRFDDRLPRAQSMALVLASLQPETKWVPDSNGAPRSGQLLLRGLTCFESEARAVGDHAEPLVRRDGCARTAQACELVPVDEIDIPPHTDLDGWIDPAWLQEGRLRLGFYALQACVEPVFEPAPEPERKPISAPASAP